MPGLPKEDDLVLTYDHEKQRVAKLPEWAQRLFATQQKHIANLELQVVQMASRAKGKEGSRIRVTGYLTGEHPSEAEKNAIYLPPCARVQFLMGGKWPYGQTLEFALRRKSEGGGFEKWVEAYASSGGLLIRPSVSNVADIILDPRS